MHRTFGDSFKIPLNTSTGKNAFGFSRADRF